MLLSRRFLGSEFKDDREIVMTAVSQDGERFPHMKVTSLCKAGLVGWRVPQKPEAGVHDSLHPCVRTGARKDGRSLKWPGHAFT